MLSFGEKLLRGFVNKCFPNQTKIYNYRGVGIINPDTNKPLEIDIYYPNLKLGFEFNGRQHRTDEAQRERDKFKRKEAKKLGILLITVWTNSLDGDLFYTIQEKCEKANIKVKKPSAAYLLSFNETTDQYKKSITKMNRRIKSKTFVKRGR